MFYMEYWEILRDRIANTEGLTEAGLAKSAGLANSTIRQMIAKQRNPNLTTALKICSALETTLEDFMKRSDGSRAAELRFLAGALEDEDLEYLVVSGRGLLEKKAAEG